MKVVIITGMSGAGRSRAADWFEDQGYYCVDNMPPALIDSFLEMASVDTNRIDKVAFVTDLRSGSFFDRLSQEIDELRGRPGIELTVLYMEAAPKEIVRRYNEVRRNHPLSGAEASIDGHYGTSIATGDRIEIRKAAKTSKILRMNQVSFVEILNQKLL